VRTKGPSGADGPAAQAWDPERYARTARYVADLGEPLIEILAPRAGERILDLGCGDGALTRKLMTRGATIVGVDSSPEQVAAAVAAGVDARVIDGENLPYQEEFDAVFSNAALHWMRRPAPVVAGVWRALKPGGRFVGEMGGEGNVRRIVAALAAGLDRRGLDGRAANPWFFPTPGAYRALLESQGFTVLEMRLFERPTPLPGHMADWLATFGGSFTRALPAAERPAFVAEVVASLRPALCATDGAWTADYVRLRFHAAKPDFSAATLAPESAVVIL
jgi:trans-aconitate methyltransferase